MSHKISILFPLLGLSCAQQFNHGMLPIHRGASTRQEQRRQPYGAAAYDPVAQQEYDQKFEKAFKNRSFKDIPALANDPRLVFYGNVTLLLGMLHIIIPHYIASKGNTCELLLNRLLALESGVDYECTSQSLTSEKGLTLLQLAIQYNRTEIALKLINKFKEVSEPKLAAMMRVRSGRSNKTVFHMALEKKNYSVMCALLSVPGIDVTAKSPRSESEKQEIYESAFMRAVLSEEIPEICRLVKDPRVHKLRSVRSITDIVLAIYYILNAPYSNDNAAAAYVLADKFVKEKDFSDEAGSDELGNMYNYVGRYNQFLKLAIQNNYEQIVETLIENIKYQENPVAIIKYKQRPNSHPLLHYLMHFENQHLIHLKSWYKGKEYEQKKKEYDEKSKKRIQMLLDVSGIDLDIQDKYGRTPLHQACKHSNDAVVTLLLNKGATVNIKDESGSTPLHEACRGSNDAVVQLLLDKGATVNIKDESGRTPLHEACRGSNDAVVQLLLNKGATVNIQDESGRTPLHQACKHSNDAVVTLLLNKGADVNLQDEYGSTPLHEACRGSNDAVVTLLLDKGADVNLQDEYGSTPLHEACKSSNYRVVQLLLDKGATVDLKNEYDCTPLHEASKRLNYTVVKLLLDEGASVDVQDNFGSTPLHEASQLCNYGVVKLLLAKGAKVNVEDDSRSTPLDYALEAQSVELSDTEKVIKLLADHKVKQTSGEVGSKM